MTTVSIQKPYAEKKRVQINCGKKGRTKQSMRDECDINQIMAKYQKTGAITHFNQNKAQYGFADALTFTESMQIVTQGQQLFNGLPSTIRKKFGNDPGQFLEFVQDPKNAEEMISLGLSSSTEAVGRPSSTEDPSDAQAQRGDEVEGESTTNNQKEE